MKDLFGREIDYMRISVTDRCNLRCRYCMPKGVEWIPMEQILTFEEIVTVCEEAAKLGIRKIKITGGEPLVRRNVTSLVGMIKKVPGIEQVTLTTNGVELLKYAGALKDAGIDGINVSLDTLDRETFREITGFDCLSDVLAGISEAMKLGIRVKINTVLQPGINETAWKDMVLLTKEKPVDIRFIEMMPIGSGSEINSISNQKVQQEIKEMYGQMEADTSVHGNGPAVYYKIPGFEGSIGFISAIHGKFCKDCNRIRMTATGELKPCLCYGDSVSIKETLRSGNLDEMKHILESVILKKPKAHCFEEKKEITETKKMAQIGG